MIDTDNLKYIPQSKFLRERPVMLITDQPLGIEMKQRAAFSSVSANMAFSELDKIGISRLQIHASYLFNFRVEKGDLSALFHQPGLPVSEYISWPQSKKDAILNFAYNDLVNLKQTIKEVDPSLIICAGRWALYFLTGETTFAETKRSNFGTLLKWRASHLELGDFWQYTKPHIVMPILPQQAIWNLPEYSMIMRQDYVRIGLIAKHLLKTGSIEEYTHKGRNYNFIINPNFATVKQFFLDELIKLGNSSKPIYYAVDVETRQGYHDCVGIAWSETEAICIPWAGVDTPLLWSEQEEAELNYLLMQFLNHKNCAQIGQNYSYDMQYFWRDLVINTKPTIDTMVQQHSMFSCMEKNLSFLSSLYAKVYRYWKDEGAFHKGKTDQEHWTYNCKDCCYTFEIAFVMQNMLDKSPKNIQEAYRFQLEETLPALVNIMNRGVRANKTEKTRLYNELTNHMSVLKDELNTIVGEPFNPNSAPQKLALFYDLFQLPKQFDPKTKRPSAGAAALATLAEKFPLVKPIADRVSEFGNLKTFSSTFLNAGLDIDGRMRTAYNLCGTDTYRLNSRQNAFGSGMNLQNIPSGGTTALGRKLPNCKQLFIPGEGKTFFDIDLDSADLRIVVAISGATGLQQMLDEGLKPYVEMIKEYYHDPTADKEHPQYRTFKGIAHGTNYIGSAKGLAARLGLLVHEVERIQKWYLQANPEIGKWHKELRAQVMKRGWIENIFGYRMYFLNKNQPTLMNIAAAWEPQCLSKNHNVLTTEGLLPIAEITLQHKVAVWDLETSAITWEHPIAVHEGKEEIVKLTGSLELEATANHKMAFHTGDNTKNRVRLLKDLPKQGRIPLTGNLQDAGAGWSKAQGALLAAFQADGWIDSERNTLNFEFHKEKKILLLRRILNKLELEYTETVVRREATCFYVKNISKYLKPEMKESGSYLLNIGSEALFTYLDSIKYWDGYFNQKLGVVEYCSTRLSHITYLKQVIHLFGGRARIYKPDIRGKKPLYRLNFNFKKVNAGLAYTQRQELPEQDVYCLTTRTGFFMTELNDCVSVTGNSTVGLLINRGMVKLDQAYMKQESEVEVLLQVHDSLAGQYPTTNPKCKQEIINACEIKLPYKNPITIPVDISTSEISWGECK